MGGTVRQISPDALTPEGWAPYGWLPVADTDPTDGNQRLSFAWGDVHVNLIGHRLDEVTSVPGGLRCQVLFRHATHTQGGVKRDRARRNHRDRPDGLLRAKPHHRPFAELLFQLRKGGFNCFAAVISHDIGLLGGFP